MHNNIINMQVLEDKFETMHLDDQLVEIQKKDPYDRHFFVFKDIPNVISGKVDNIVDYDKYFYIAYYPNDKGFRVIEFFDKVIQSYCLYMNFKDLNYVPVDFQKIYAVNNGKIYDVIY